jgi:hypothetical protein
MRYVARLFIVLLIFALNVFGQTSTPEPIDSASEIKILPKGSPSPAKFDDTEVTARKTADDPTSIGSGYVRKGVAARIPRFESAPTIDGQLNDPIWKSAAVFGDFLQTDPGDNVAPVSPTEVMMGYDAKNLYIAFRIKEDRDKVRATEFISTRSMIAAKHIVCFSIPSAYRLMERLPSKGARITVSIS